MGLFGPTLPEGYIIAHLYDADEDWYHVIRKFTHPETQEVGYYWVPDVDTQGRISLGRYESETAAIRAACAYAKEQRARDARNAAERRAKAQERVEKQLAKGKGVALVPPPLNGIKEEDDDE
jgi:hypothetical protein